MLNNSFGFGGTNASLVMKQVDRRRRHARKVASVVAAFCVALLAARSRAFGWSWWAVRAGSSADGGTSSCPRARRLTSVGRQARGGRADRLVATASCCAPSVLGSGDPIQAGEFLILPARAPATILDTLQHGEAIRALRHRFPRALPSIMVCERLMAEPLLTGDRAGAATKASVLPESYDFERGESRAAVLGADAAGDEGHARRAVAQARAGHRRVDPAAKR